jgi:hypothetical protein
MTFTERALKILKYNRLTAIGAGIVLLGNFSRRVCAGDRAVRSQCD